MTHRDEIAELADRARELSEFEFEIEFAALTEEERDAFFALFDERKAHGEERLEALQEDNRVLRLLLAYREGAITAREFVEAVRGAVPDPLVQE
jgi:hypothetical protein